MLRVFLKLLVTRGAWYKVPVARGTAHISFSDLQPTHSQAALESVDIWIAEKQDVLKEYADIPMDREKLDRMLGDHEVTVRDIEDRKPNIESILEKGGLIVEALKHPGELPSILTVLYCTFIPIALCYSCLKSRNWAPIYCACYIYPELYGKSAYDCRSGSKIAIHESKEIREYCCGCMLPDRTHHSYEESSVREAERPGEELPRS